MLISLFNKFKITPYKLDISLLFTGIVAAYISFTLWPTLALTYATMFMGGSIFADAVLFFMAPKEERKHLWTRLYKIWTDEASNALFKKTENNTLTIPEAKWFLSKGLFRDKADFVGGVHSENEISVLHWAAHHGRADLIRFFTAQGASIAKESYLGTPFHVGVKRSQAEILPALFFNKRQFAEHKCTFDIPAHHAAINGDEATFEALILLGALSTEAEKYHALEAAIMGNKVHILKCYDKYFSDILTLQISDRNLIHVAAAEGAISCLQYLLEQAKPVHLFAVSQEKMTPIDEAYVHNTRCYTILREKGCSATIDEQKAEALRINKSSIVFEPSFEPFTLPSSAQLCGESDEAFSARKVHARLN